MARTTFVLLLAVCGCSHFTPKQKDYRTVVGSPNRDEESARRLTEKARRQIDHGKIDNAEQSLQEALIADVTYGPAHNNLGKLYLLQGKHYLAAWEFGHATRLLPEIAEPHNNLGLVYESANKLEEAVAHFETAYAMEPTEAEFIGNLARVRHKLNENDPDLKRLLEELIMHDSRPSWVKWARDLLGRHNLPDGEFVYTESTEELDTEEPNFSRSDLDAEPLPPPEPPLLTPPANNGP